MLKSLGKFAFSLASFLLSAWVAYTYWLHDWNLVWMLMVSVLLHEFGHWIMLLVFGLKPGMIFVPLLGAAVSAPNRSKLNHKQTAIVSLAGPFVTFLLFLLGMAFRLGGYDFGTQLASLNASLAWFNLIPLLILDGKRFFDAIYASLDEEGDRIVSSIVGAITILVGFVLIAIGRAGYFYLLIYYGVKKGSYEDDPNDAYSSKAMTVHEAKTLIALYVVMTFVAMIASAFLPFWIK